MKKIITTVFAIALSFSGFAQRGCNSNTPGWGNSLGTVSFDSDRTRTIGNQTWSDAVTATACQKRAFNGGSFDARNFNADCRFSPVFPGDFFSWCAVVRFQNQLCPYPWRVPTQQDFINLDIALGGTGNNRTDLNFVNSNYITRWGGEPGGFYFADFGSGMLAQGGMGSYWSQSEHGPAHAFTFGFNVRGGLDGNISLDGASPKHAGHKLRCVRDN